MTGWIDSTLDHRCLARFPSLALTLRYLPTASAAHLAAGYALLTELLALEELEHPEVSSAKHQWWRQEIERFATGRPEHPLTQRCLALWAERRRQWAAGLSSLLAALETAPESVASSVEAWWQRREPRYQALTQCEVLLACGPHDESGEETVDPATFAADHAPWAGRIIDAAEYAGRGLSPAPPPGAVPPLELQARYRFGRDDWVAAGLPRDLRRRVLSEWLALPAGSAGLLAAALANARNRRYAHFLWTVYLAERRRRRLCRRARPSAGTVTPGDALALWRVARRLPPAVAGPW